MFLPSIFLCVIQKIIQNSFWEDYDSHLSKSSRRKKPIFTKVSVTILLSLCLQGIFLYYYYLLIFKREQFFLDVF